MGSEMCIRDRDVDDGNDMFVCLGESVLDYSFECFLVEVTLDVVPLQLHYVDSLLAFEELNLSEVFVFERLDVFEVSLNLLCRVAHLNC